LIFFFNLIKSPLKDKGKYGIKNKKIRSYPSHQQMRWKKDSPFCLQRLGKQSLVNLLPPLSGSLPRIRLNCLKQSRSEAHLELFGRVLRDNERDFSSMVALLKPLSAPQELRDENLK